MSTVESELETWRARLRELGWSWAAEQLSELTEPAVSEDRWLCSFQDLAAQPEIVLLLWARPGRARPT